ncbi:MAG: asparagine synthase (glutamine-hydrolyzing) [Burkholderiales bacterium]|nr:asparagine synthase (glutamine-hydrolyzing) [Burkholderiales bacterium]
MCGYVSIIRRKPGTVDINKIKASLKAMHHRGPDEETIWLDPQGLVLFGYVRLSLVGLSNGTQPLATNDEEIVMMVNGELYEYKEIREELEKEGCIFKTSSDSEIALYLYKLYGIDGLKRLRGEFSFVLYDRRRKIFLAVRDRLGVKPLYYAHHEGDWYFSSEIKGLLALGVPAIWDMEAYATRAFILQDRTLFKGVKAVEPGSWVLINDGGLKSGRYWDFDFAKQGNNQFENASEGEIINTVRKEIEHAVKIRLEADVALGVGLSGGIDSSAVLGVASKLSNKSLDAFHLSFPNDPDFDESKFALIAAKHNNAQFHNIPVTTNDLADNFLDTIWHTEMPFFNAHSIAKLILCKAIGKNGTKAILTGEGADEIFCGYPHFKRDLALYDSNELDKTTQKEILAQINQFEAENQNNQIPDDLLWVKDSLKHGVSWLETQAKLITPITALHNDNYAKDYGNVDGYRQFFDRLDHSKLAGRSPVHRSMYLLAKTCLPNIVLTTLGDRMEMAGSIEGRPPLIDHKLVELICQLPIKLKLRGNTVKYILREAMKPYLPEELYQRKKHYFRAPPTSRNPTNCRLYQLMYDELSSSNAASLPFFEHKKIKDMLNVLPQLADKERLQLDYVLTELTGLCLMQKKFGLNAGGSL